MLMLRLIKSAFVLLMVTLVVGLSQNKGYAAEPMAGSRADDYVAIQSLIVKYAHVYDSLDVEGYVSVFTEDAQFSFTGNTLNGRAQIRDFITKAASRPAAVPATKSYHSISNTMIEFVSDTEAHHRSYWQVVSGPVGGPMSISNMGFYDDVVVKQNGQWLIKQRTIPQ
jgi:uncharacterized protein (TIGR02246 family)